MDSLQSYIPEMEEYIRTKFPCSYRRPWYRKIHSFLIHLDSPFRGSTDWEASHLVLFCSVGREGVADASVDITLPHCPIVAEAP